MKQFSFIAFAVFGLVVAALHAAYRWGGFGAEHIAGTMGDLGVPYLASLLFWPVWAVSCVCGIELISSKTLPKQMTYWFAPIVTYGALSFVVAQVLSS